MEPIGPWDPAERRRRGLAAFARLLVVYLRRDSATRLSIEAIAASLDADDPHLDPDGRAAAIDAMDDLLTGPAPAAAPAPRHPGT